MALTKVLHELGSIEVFEIVGTPGVYWHDKKSDDPSTCYGPFADVYSALKHFSLGQAIPSTLVPKEIGAQPVLTNLIEVDFIAKRRL